MTDQAWRLLTIIGAAVVAVGFYLGFAPVSVPAINLSENCGSPFVASDYATNGSGSFIVAQCDSQSSKSAADPEREAKVRARFEDDHA